MLIIFIIIFYLYILYFVLIYYYIFINKIIFVNFLYIFMTIMLEFINKYNLRMIIIMELILLKIIFL